MKNSYIAHLAGTVAVTASIAVAAAAPAHADNSRGIDGTPWSFDASSSYAISTCSGWQ